MVTDPVKYRLKQAMGIIPEDWDIDEIQNHADITTGAKNTQDRIEDGKFPFFVRSQKIERINTYSYDGESVLTAGDGGTGKVFHYINGKFDFHQRVYSISNFDNCLEGYFFYLYFSSHFLARIMSMTAKSSVDSVRRDMIAEMLIPLPEKNEQIAISTTMKDIIELIETINKTIEKKKSIKQGAMQELLTGKRRLEGFDGEWIEDFLGLLLLLLKDGTHNPPKRISKGIPLLASENIHDGEIDFEKSSSYISEQDYKELQKQYHISKMDLLLTIVGTIGRVSLVKQESKFSVQRSVAILRANNRISPQFLYFIIQSYTFQLQLQLNKNATAQSGIYLNSLSKIKLFFPKMVTEQEKIAEILFDMDSEIKELEAKKDKYIMIKNGMMQKLLTGEIRLT